jgi:hypothetical protein
MTMALGGIEINPDDLHIAFRHPKADRKDASGDLFDDLKHIDLEIVLE